MNDLEKQAAVFGTIFTLSNKLQVLGDQFDPNITIKQWLFLVRVSKFDSPPTVSEVAKSIGYSRQNAKRIAATLEAGGYVILRRDEFDARAWRIELTDRCKSYFMGRYEREIEFLQRVFSGFDSELTLGLYNGLTKLERNIGSMMTDEEEPAD
jgi:DNA-binding MarR family transcriptional regulator